MGLLRGLNIQEAGDEGGGGLSSHARLAAAVAFRDLAEAGRLVYSGAEVTVSGRSCALMMAIASGQDEMAEILAERANLAAVDASGRTALMQAAEAGHARMVGSLMRRGAEVDRRGPGGLTPLMAAAAHGHLGACSALARSSDLRLRDEMGFDALEHAARTGKAMCAQLIMESGGGLFGSGEIRAALELAACLGEDGAQTVEALAKRLARQEAEELAWALGDFGHPGSRSEEGEGEDRRRGRI